MNTDIQRGDARLRRTSIFVIVFASVVAIACVFSFQRWMAEHAASASTADLIAQLRRWIGIALTASGLCLLVLAGSAARLARRIGEQQRWPVADARVLRDTPIRRGAAALRIAKGLNALAVVLIALAIGTGVLSWRLFVAGQ